MAGKSYRIRENSRCQSIDVRGAQRRAFLTRFRAGGMAAGGPATGSAPQTPPPWGTEFPSALHYQTEFGNEGLNPACQSKGPPLSSLYAALSLEV